MADERAAARLGWVGAGSIGLPMLARLVAAGHRVRAFDLDPARMALARAAGAEAAASPAETARASDAVFLCLPNADAVHAAGVGASGRIARRMDGKWLLCTRRVGPHGT